MKTCTICKNPYPATPAHFYRNKTEKDGLQSSCKLCQDESVALSRERNPEIVRKYVRRQNERLQRQARKQTLAEDLAAGFTRAQIRAARRLFARQNQLGATG